MSPTTRQICFINAAHLYTHYGLLVLATAVLVAILSMAAFSAWGFGESFAGAPHAEGWMIYPLFWALFGCVAPMVRSSN